jgi:acetylornithine deacetylase/succinyl-diaminopimelate desuccinylase-like protein
VFPPRCVFAPRSRSRGSGAVSASDASIETRPLEHADLALDHVQAARVPGHTVDLRLAQEADYKPEGPAFAAADRAHEKAWGRKLLQIGVGGSIPFVALFGRRYGTLPLILNGVMNPLSSPHGPNESLHLGVFRKAILANVYLLDELSALPRRP